ncbi:hypothetical protein F2P81_024559 [Scophthalmus maximus]|uniref:Uncharacterized protein n=1 Tax=Scophthalmus maximus TaxID=52904 RepID=A0A6A4RUI2_SCOMX|nr:hypothetical protein F2P81_024559 [Scophthalmus maximus]
MFDFLAQCRLSAVHVSVNAPEPPPAAYEKQMQIAASQAAWAVTSRGLNNLDQVEYGVTPGPFVLPSFERSDWNNRVSGISQLPNPPVNRRLIRPTLSKLLFFRRHQTRYLHDWKDCRRNLFTYV